MTGNSARQLHGYLATLRTMSAPNPQAAWGQLLQINDPSEVVVAMTQVAGLLDDTARSLRAAHGIIDTTRKLAYLPDWTNPVYGWYWPGNAQNSTHDMLTSYPRQEAVDVLESVADTLDRFGYDEGLSSDARESLLNQLLDLREQAQSRVSDPTARYFLITRIQRLIDGLTAPDVRGSDVFASSAAAAATEFQHMAADERLSESDRSWMQRAYEVTLRAVHLAGLGTTLFLSIRHDPASGALALGVAKDAIGRLARRADHGALNRPDTPKEIEMKAPPVDQETDGAVGDSSPAA